MTASHRLPQYRPDVLRSSFPFRQHRTAERSSGWAGSVGRRDRTQATRPLLAAIVLIVLAAFLVPAVLHGEVEASAPGKVHHVAPGGSADGDGSEKVPWDLRTALGHPAAVQPGDTILLHHGTYVGGFKSMLEGTAKDPIVVRPAPGEWARIDMNDNDPESFHVFRIEGRYTQFWGLEVFSSDTDSRRSSHPSSWPQDQDRGSVEVSGDGIKLINMILHDLNKGVGFWSSADGGEIYGSIIYNNGWWGTDRFHGPGIYSQNTHSTPKRVAENIVFNQFYNGLYITGSSDTEIDNYVIEGNVLFNNGAAFGAGFNPAHSVLIGGGNVADNIVFRENRVYTASEFGTVRFGLNAGGRNVEITDNYVYDNLLMNGTWDNLTFAGNTIGGKSNYMVNIESPAHATSGDFVWNNNRYFATRIYPLQVGGRARSFEAWQNDTGFDANSEISDKRPTGTVIDVRPNEYVAGRGHVVVYNWDDANSVQIDLSAIVPTGAAYEIHNVLDLFGRPLVSADDYDGGPITLPMLDQPSPSPIGWESAESHVQSKEFGAFIVQATMPPPNGSD